MANPVRKNLTSPVKDKSLQLGHSNGANKFSLVSMGCPKNLVDSDNLFVTVEITDVYDYDLKGIRVR